MDGHRDGHRDGRRENHNGHAPDGFVDSPISQPGMGRPAASVMSAAPGAVVGPGPKSRKKPRRGAGSASDKRRCISTACVACRKRKSKCDGALPSCAACASVYGTECVYDPNSDHRRKGVYREKVDSMKAQSSTLQILVEAILNASEDHVPDIVKRIRTCDSLDTVAEQFLREQELSSLDDQTSGHSDDGGDDSALDLPVEGERELAGKMGELRLENGSVRFIGGTSHLIYLGDPNNVVDEDVNVEEYSPGDDPITSWTRVTKDTQLVTHLMNMYFNYHYPYFTTLSKTLFWRDYKKGRVGLGQGTVYCSPLLVNAMLALGCHFSDVDGAYAVPGDSRTKGNHFFAEAKRIILENDEYARPRLVTVQALALMSVREAGCAREGKGWVYSGMAFRMAQDIGLNLELAATDKERMTEHEADARRITFWGCFLFDKCWSNYLGRLPQIPRSSFNVSKFDVFPDEDAAPWCPLTDAGFDESLRQPARTRAIALQLSALCEISSDLLVFFYHPSHIGRSSGKAVELKKLSELHRRLEEWRKGVPKELEPQEGQQPNVILMHMFFHLQYIHLFRPFLKYAPAASPLPPHVSPRRICTANAGAISKLMRLYKKTWNLRQICNIAVYMLHSACTIHLLNLPEKTARRDITHGLRHLEEIAEDWLCARRTLSILSVLARKWKCELPLEAGAVLHRTDERYGSYSTSEIPSPRSTVAAGSPPPSLSPHASHGAAATGHRESSPLSRYAQAHVAPGAGQMYLGDQMAVTPTMQAMGATSPQPHQQGIPIDASTMALPADVMTAWSRAPTTTTAPVGYPAIFATMNAPGLTPEPQPQPQPQPPPQQQQQQPGSAGNSSPGSGVNMDSQDWFLNDGARWQQSFETWDMGGMSPSSSAFVFGERGGASPAATGVSGVGGRDNMRSNSVDQHLAGIEDLNTSLTDGGWLSGLD